MSTIRNVRWSLPKNARYPRTPAGRSLRLQYGGNLPEEADKAEREQTMFLQDGEIKNKRAYEAMMKGLAAHGKFDLSRWPEDVTNMIEKVCELWNLRPPETKKSKAYWIQSARELMDACGEFGVFAIEQVRLDFERVMEENRRKGIGGVAPFIVEGPNSLVKVARAKAGELRSKADTSQKAKRYDSGEFAEFIEH